MADPNPDPRDRLARTLDWMRTYKSWSREVDAEMFLREFDFWDEPGYSKAERHDLAIEVLRELGMTLDSASGDRAYERMKNAQNDRARMFSQDEEEELDATEDRFSSLPRLAPHLEEQMRASQEERARRSRELEDEEREPWD